LQRSVTEIRRSRSGRPSVSVTVIAIILAHGGSPAEPVVELATGAVRHEAGRAERPGPFDAVLPGAGLSSLTTRALFACAWPA